MRPSCKRCSGFLVKKSEMVLYEGRIDFIVCLICGWRIYRQGWLYRQPLLDNQQRVIKGY